MNNLFFYWLLVALLCLSIEMISPSLFLFLSFFIGALIVALCTLVIEPSWFIQLTLFFTGSFTAFFAIYKLMKKNNIVIEEKHYTSNAAALIGKRAIVTQPINQMTAGQIKIDGQYWLAKTNASQSYEIGEFVQIIEIIGCHCVIKKL